MKTFDWIILIVFFVLIGTLVFLGLQIKSDGAKCIANPLIYGVKDLEKGYKFATCNCNAFYGFNGTIKFNVNSTGITEDNSSKLDICN